MVMVFHVFVDVPGAGQRLLFEFVELAAAGRRAVHVRQWRHERLQREPFTSFVVFFFQHQHRILRWHSSVMAAVIGIDLKKSFG